MVSRRNAVARIVLLNAMIPLPGETPGEWFEATGSGEARQAANRAAGRSEEFDVEEVSCTTFPMTYEPTWPKVIVSLRTHLSASRAGSRRGPMCRSMCWWALMIACFQQSSRRVSRVNGLASGST
jgi:hypothetical protein